MVKLDKMTGKTVWTSKDLSDTAAYSSITAADIQGVRTYMMTINAQGTVEKIDQVLVDANFKRIVPGMTITEVRRILGRNSKEQRFGMTPNELTHKYKFNANNEDQYFDVTYNAEGRVKEVGYDQFSLQRGSSR